MSIEVKKVSKNFGTFQALKDVDLPVSSGELVALLGPSGSGKTTLLRIIAGLETPDSGAVFFGGDEATQTHVRERRVGFVFQHYALFRHMTVFNNVAFGLQVRPRASRPSKSDIRDRVMELLSLVQLEGLANRYPSQLSGGQRQRIALARALAVEPRVLLLDEPFGALDARVRKELRRWVRTLHDRVGLTSVFVTHDQEEALELADRVVVMNQGKIEQVGKPEDLYHNPANPFVFDFLIDVNLFHGRVQDGQVIFGPRQAGDSSDGESTDGSTELYVRPYHIGITNEQRGLGCFRATVRYINAAGPRVKVELDSEWGTRVHAEISQEEYRSLQLIRDADVYLMPRDIQVFLSEGRELGAVKLHSFSYQDAGK